MEKSENANIATKISGIRTVEKNEGIEAAEKALIGLVRENPSSHQVYLALAGVLTRQKKTDYALRAADKAAELAPMDDKAHATVGLIRMRAGDTDGAADAFRQALVLNPESSQALLGAASIKLADESYDDALELCERVLETDFDVSRAHSLIAKINFKAGRSEAAEAALEKLLKSGQGSERMLKSYVRLMRSEGKLDEALDVAQMNLNTGPASRKKIAQFSRLAHSAGRPELGLDQYRELVASGEARDRDRVRLASMLIKQGVFDEANTVIDGLAARKFLRPVVEKMRGDIELAKGDPGQAIKRYRRALHAAKVPQTDAPEVPEGASTDEVSRLWRDFTGKAVRGALKALRPDRGPDADGAAGLAENN